MIQYLNLLQEIKDKGTWKEAAREGMPKTLSLFGAQFRHNLQNGFPILTTKKLSFKNIVVELLWFLRGDTNIKFLVDNGCNIWNEDAYNFYKKKGGLLSFEEFKLSIGKTCGVSGITLGDCGKQYGWLWRNWEYIQDIGDGGYELRKVDQIKELILGLQTNPTSRRHILTAWNPTTLNGMALNACHAMVQFNCREYPLKERNMWARWYIGQGVLNGDLSSKECDELDVPRYYLDCQMYQRSADVFLGVPYNIASYALLTHILCKICNMVPGEFIHSFGDVHIYENHLNQVDEQLSRIPTHLPDLKIRKDLSSLIDFEVISPFFYKEDFILTNYEPQPSIKAKLSTGLK